MSKLIDQPQHAQLTPIDSDWVQLQIGDQAFILSYDAAVDLAFSLATVTAQMDETVCCEHQNRSYLN